MAIAIQKIYGGFGNQAFQISAGVLICKRLNIKTLLLGFSSSWAYINPKSLVPVPLQLKINIIRKVDNMFLNNFTISSHKEYNKKTNITLTPTIINNFL